MSKINSIQQKSKKLHGDVYKKALLAMAVLAALSVLIYSVSTAWYSNIAETKGMVIETDVWGFDGQVQVKEAAAPVAPGGIGFVNMQISNDSDQINTLYVSVDKSGMSEELQKRIYFYAPAATQVGKETVGKVYLSPYNSFAYTVMPKSTLLLSQEHTAATPVCYEWVYDMVGYYVYGTLSEAGGRYTFTGRDSTLQPEYIRPVVYDFSKATFDENGNLLTVDGSTTTREFLNKLAETDGYDAIGDKEGDSNYYPVSVKDNADGTKTGVWVYLCTRSEVEKATELDTRIGEYAYLVKNDRNPKGYDDIKALKYNAQIHVTAQTLRTEETNVEDQKSLLAALSAPDSGEAYQKICLTKDLEVTNALKIAENKKVVLDLNGKSILCSGTAASDPVLDIAPNSQVTVINGTINGAGRETAVHVVGADAAFSEVTIQGRLLIDDSLSANTQNRTSLVRLYRSELTADGADQVGIHVFGNGGKSSQSTAVIVENSKIKASFIGICGNGSDAYYGTEIQIKDSSVSGTWAGIYQPQRSSRLTVFGGSVIEGFTAIAVKGGSVIVRDSTVRATAEPGATGLFKNPTDAQLSKNGFIDTGAAVYVEANYAWADKIRVELTKSTISSRANEPVLVLGPQKEKITLTQVEVRQ